MEMYQGSEAYRGTVPATQIAASAGQPPAHLDWTTHVPVANSAGPGTLPLAPALDDDQPHRQRPGNGVGGVQRAELVARAL